MAILTLLVRLALRAGEVAGLSLDDVNWRAGQLMVHGKANRVAQLPLPVDVGEAMVAYLQRGRPATAQGRSVFVRVRAPHRALTPAGVSAVVFAAGQRAGLGEIRAHRLRHTAATGLLRAGASLTQVGQVLGHRQPLTTAIYAKVDDDALRVLARPWPGRCGMNRALDQALADYLALRRALGYKLERAGKLLAQFVGYLEEVGAATITIEHAVAWATLPAASDGSWWAYRLSVVRGFAAYLRTIDPATEVPPTDLLPSRKRRATPHVYSDAEIAAVIAAADGLRGAGRTATYQTLIGLLAVTGMRVGEAIRLDRRDLDLDAGVLVVRDSNFGKSRRLPLHPTATAALAGYLQHRDQVHPTGDTPAVFVSTAGTRLLYCNVQHHLRQVGRPGRPDPAVGDVPAARA